MVIILTEAEIKLKQKEKQHHHVCELRKYLFEWQLLGCDLHSIVDVLYAQRVKKLQKQPAIEYDANHYIITIECGLSNLLAK